MQLLHMYFLKDFLRNQKLAKVFLIAESRNSYFQEHPSRAASETI